MVTAQGEPRSLVLSPPSRRTVHGRVLIHQVGDTEEDIDPPTETAVTRNLWVLNAFGFSRKKSRNVQGGALFGLAPLRIKGLRAIGVMLGYRG